MQQISFTLIPDYSEKAFAVACDYDNIFCSEFKALGGRFNPRLKCGPGFIFSKAKCYDIVLYILSEQEVPHDTKSIEDYTTPDGGNSKPRPNSGHSKHKPNSEPCPDWVLSDAERIEVTKMWHPTDKDPKNYYSVIIKLENGEYYPISKDPLKTSFIFGYSDCGQGPTSEDANKSEAAAQSAEYFLSENLYDLETKIKHLEDPLQCYYWLIKNNYYSKQWGLDSNRIHPGDPRAIDLLDTWERKLYETGNYTPISDENRKRIIYAYKQAAESRRKRCEKWLKRYGVEKIQTRTYWIDY